jgi:hypothetical protein
VERVKEWVKIPGHSIHSTAYNRSFPVSDRIFLNANFGRGWLIPFTYLGLVVCDFTAEDELGQAPVLALPKSIEVSAGETWTCGGGMVRLSAESTSIFLLVLTVIF